jgi:thiol-disulfide isomerase/thioredoxin
MLPDALVFSFKGNPHEFQDRLRGANVLVFFYKAACGPCAVIRSKLIHAVTDHLPMGANPFLQGADGRRRILVAHRHKDVAPPPAAPQETVDDADDGDKVPGSASPPREDTHGTFSAAAASAEASMATEDREACERACRTLEDVSKAFPHRMIFLTVDTNENPKLTALHDIRSLPTFIAYRNGRMVGRVEGADEQEVSKLVHTITKEGGAPQTGTSDAETTEGVQRAA